MQHISSHITGPASRKQERITERGEMLKYFLEKLNPSRLGDGLAPMTMGRMGKTLEAIPTKDLYYLKSVCEQANNFSKKFWWEINPKNHTEEKIKERAAARLAWHAKRERGVSSKPLPRSRPAPQATRALPRDPRTLY